MYLDAEGDIETKIVPIRLPGKLLERLQKEADRKGITISSNIAHMLHDYTSLHSPAFASGMFLFPKKIASSLMKQLDVDKIEELSQHMAKRDLANLMFAAGNTNNFDSFIKTLLAWATVSGFSVRDTPGGDMRNIVIKHDMGAKWSLFMSRSIEHYLGYLKVKGGCRVGDDRIVITFENSHLG